MLDTGEHAVGCAALSRFELAELQRLQLPVIVVVPSDALAATLDESAEGLELHLPLHLRPHLAGQPCVRFGDPRRLSQQLSELLSKLADVGVLLAPEDTEGADDASCTLSEAALASKQHGTLESSSSDHDGVMPEMLLSSQIAAQPDVGVRALAKWEREHTAAVVAAEERLHAAVAEHTAAQATLDSSKKKKEKEAAAAALAAKAALVDEARAALETIQAEAVPEEVAALQGSKNNPDNPDPASVTKPVQHQQTTQMPPSNRTTQSTAVGSGDKDAKVGASSERASSVAAGRRVAALTADVRFAPAHGELARAAEMQAIADDDTALHDGAGSTVPLAKRLRNPELLLQQLQRHERVLQRQNDRLYAAETAARDTATRVAASESALEAAQAHADSMDKFCFLQKGTNELRLQQAGEHDKRLLALESGLKVAVKRTEAVADLYADVLTQLKRTAHATPEEADAANALDLVQRDSGAAVGRGGAELCIEEIAADGLHTPRSSSHTEHTTGGREPTAAPAVVWTVESDPGEYVTFPQRYASRVTTAYFKRERVVELRSTPRPQGLTGVAAHGSPGSETTLAREWSGWWSAFGSVPMQVDLCAMQMQEIYPAAGRTKGWVLFGSWNGVLVKPLNDEIVAKVSAMQRIATHAAASTHTAAVTSTELKSATHSTRRLGSSSAAGGSGTSSGLHDSTVALAGAENAGAVGYRHMQAMGVKSDGSLEHTLRELSSHVADLYLPPPTSRFISPPIFQSLGTETCRLCYHHC